MVKENRSREGSGASTANEPLSTLKEGRQVKYGRSFVGKTTSGKKNSAGKVVATGSSYRPAGKDER